MGEGVGADPLPENVQGLKKQSWNHEVHHEVQWSYVLLAVAAVAVAWFLFGGDGESVDAGAAVDGEEGEVWG